MIMAALFLCRLFAFRASSSGVVTPAYLVAKLELNLVNSKQPYTNINDLTRMLEWPTGLLHDNSAN